MARKKEKKEKVDKPATRFVKGPYSHRTQEVDTIFPTPTPPPPPPSEEDPEEGEG